MGHKSTAARQKTGMAVATVSLAPFGGSPSGTEGGIGPVAASLGGYKGVWTRTNFRIILPPDFAHLKSTTSGHVPQWLWQSGDFKHNSSSVQQHDFISKGWFLKAFYVSGLYPSRIASL